MWRIRFFLCVSVVCCVLASCSDSKNPMSSGNTIDSQNIAQLPVGVSEWLTNSSPVEGMGAMGLFSLGIDPDKLTAEMTSLRGATLTDVLEVVDITNFLQLAPCTDCVKIKSVSMDTNGNLVVSIGIKHPFGVGDPLKPITGRNRADLHVFNVEGIIVSDTPGTTYPGLGETLAGFQLLNADGYSKYLDSAIDEIFQTSATIHPYITHFDDYSAGNFNASNPMGFESVTTPPPSGNLVMAMGCDYNFQDYVFNLPLTNMNLIYAVGCTYAVASASKNQRFTPEYRVPQHNKKAASEVGVALITNGLEAGDTASTADIEIRVVDINHGVAVGDALDEMKADSSVSGITIELPGVMTSPQIVNVSSPTGTGHDPSDPLIFTATITNTAGASEGIYSGLVKVTDSYAPGQNGSPLLNGMDGIERVDPISNPLTALFAISEFATYAAFSLSVEQGNDPPVAVLEPDPASCVMGEKIDFDGTGSYDLDGSIVLYEFDFDWDGLEVNFATDVSNATGLAQSFPYPDDGEYTAGLRVTDDLGATDYDSVQVTVSPIDVIYVDDSNTSGTENGTMQYPFNTIQEGVNFATSGYQVWVDDSGNDYSYVSINLKSNIVLKSVNWHPTDGGNTASISRTAGYILSISNSTNCMVDGFKLHGSSDYGLSMSSAADCTVRNCWITEIGLTGTNGITAISVGSSPGAILKDCEISNCEANILGGFLNIMRISQSPMTIEGCKIHDMRKTQGSGFINGLYFSNCIPQSGHSLIVHRNKIYDLNMPDSGFINTMYLSQCDDVSIYNNLIFDIAKDDAGANIGIYCNGATNTEIINNTMYDFECNTFNMGIYMNDYYPNSVASANNIIQYFHSEDATPNGWAVYFDTANPTITWNYNNQYQMSYTTIPAGVGNISSDALFLDSSNGNFHLQPGSPCIDTGDPGILDPDNSRSDMGCYGGPGGNW